MEKLHYWQRLRLRDDICRIKIENLTEEQNWELQGEVLYKLGFDESDAKYPNDTYVGNHRLNGWEHALVTSTQ